MIQTPAKVQWTIEDLALFPETEGIYYEIIQGDLFITHPHHRQHQQISLKIAKYLDIWSESTGLGVTIVAPGVIFSDADNVYPDVVWISSERLAQIEDESGHLLGAPELVIEVISAGKQNEERDKKAKLKLYSSQGVQEYWIVDRFKQQLQVYRRENGILVLTATLFNQDQITSPLLPNFSCLIQRFFVSL
ncbi:MAG TPA: Uma2 family endonuclease [Allocoleopsis sp.]